MDERQRQSMAATWRGAVRRVTAALLVAGGLVATLPGSAAAQKSVAELLGQTATPEGQPKRFLEELTLFGFIDTSYVWNLGHAGRGNVNDLRLYDFYNEFTLNMVELSVKKDPSDRYPFGFGVVGTGG